MANRWDTGRTEAFSDGVFAIAITLPVLDISMPEADFHDLWRGILNQWPSYLGYVTSFLTIGGIWPTTACSAGWDVASSVKP
ncbi:MAG: TMEM175 family protein [Gaiellales bacterium]